VTDRRTIDKTSSGPDKIRVRNYPSHRLAAVVVWRGLAFRYSGRMKGKCYGQDAVYALQSGGCRGGQEQAVNLMVRHLTKVIQLIMVSRQFLGLVYSLYTDYLAAMLRYLSKVSEIYSTTLSKIIASGS